MKTHRLAVWPLLGAVLGAALLALLGACSPSPPNTLQGYAEGEFVLLAAPAGGYLQSLSVQRGDAVAAGQALFVLDSAIEQQALAQAQAQLSSAQARQQNLQAPRRNPEIEAAQAQLDTAQAAQRLSQRLLQQQQQLASSGFVSDTALTAARAAMERDQALVANARAVLDNARLALGRSAEIMAARSEAASAQAVQAQANVRLTQKSVTAPTPAKVQDTYFHVGEWVPAGVPVVNLLPPQNLKIRFFIPEPQRARLPVGSVLHLRCDGCSETYAATLRYVSAQAEYTPPVLYSRDARQKLVYLAEARPEAKALAVLSPGQPVDVLLP